MFKKSIIASALAIATFGANAATNTVAISNVSLEGAAAQTAIAIPNNVVTLGAEYTVGDTVTFTLAGAEFDATSAPVLTAALLGSDGAAGGAGDATDDTVTFGLLNSTATSVTFRITAQTDGGTDGVNYTDYDGAGTAVDGTFTLSGLAAKTSTVLDATGKISMTYSALTSTGLVVDSATTNKANVIDVKTQFSATATPVLNGVIDVENDRQQFTAAGEGALADSLTVTIADSAPAVYPAVYDGAVYVVKGDFSWMETDGDAGIDAAELAAATTVAFVAGGDDTFVTTINEAGTEITVTATDAAANASEGVVITFDVAGKADDSAILAVQNFVVDTTVKYTTAAAAAATKSLLADKAAGGWTLNGAQAIFNYVPVGFTGTQSNIIVSNKSTKSGGVVIEAFDDAGNSYGPVTMANEIAGGTNMRVAGTDLMSLLSASAGTKLSVTITVNAPDDAVDFSGYTQKAGTGRQAMAVKYL